MRRSSEERRKALLKKDLDKGVSIVQHALRGHHTIWAWLHGNPSLTDVQKAIVMERKGARRPRILQILHGRKTRLELKELLK
jgi:hypothetical protein